jgi:hypothetical protein
MRELPDMDTLLDTLVTTMIEAGEADGQEEFVLLDWIADGWDFDEADIRAHYGNHPLLDCTVIVTAEWTTKHHGRNEPPEHFGEVTFEAVNAAGTVVAADTGSWEDADMWAAHVVAALRELVAV